MPLMKVLNNFSEVINFVEPLEYGMVKEAF